MLREQCGFVLVQAVEATSHRDSRYPQLIIDKIHAHQLSRTLEGVVIWLTAKSTFTGVKFPKHVWRHENPLHKKELSSLAIIFKEGAIVSTPSTLNGTKAPQQGTWSTNLHYAWDIIIGRLLNVQPSTSSQEPKGDKAIMFRDFWAECVDSTLSFPGLLHAHIV